ncbi:GA4 desaturase [Colletotrichum salicis]|uniref:GA4 desaturase n=1 Tax=Colletotrichum salicis TaxID=1209931 RepID=A0A135UGU4_9PEZI|nr:GA4 desaturase [Colletotrichum salicis]
MERQQVVGSFSYYDSPETPALDDLTIIEGTSPDNRTYLVHVTDLRSLSAPLSSYTHEKHGFQIIHQPLTISPSPALVHDKKYMTHNYYPAMTELLKKKLGVRCAVVRKHSIRDIASWSTIGMNPEVGFSIESLAPFNIAHADHTPAGARAHFRSIKESDWFTENDTVEAVSQADRDEFLRLRRDIIEAEDRAIKESGIGPEIQREQGLPPTGGHWTWNGANYKGPRYAFFSVWRPFETVRRDPLAVMDISLPVSKEIDFAPLTRTYRKRPGCVPFYYSQNAMLRPLDARKKGHGVQDGDQNATGEHAWCYLSHQSPEEVYLIKFYDSDALVRKGQGQDEIALLCPHSAFYMPETEKIAARRSCELRVWCIW